jgi:hypothetical protein
MIQWGVLNPWANEILPVGSYAQAWLIVADWADKARTGISDHPDPAVVVARIGDGDWTDNNGLTYQDPASWGEDDLMADAGNAKIWLTTARRLAATDPAAAVHLVALEHEATAHGHDMEE